MLPRRNGIQTDPAVSLSIRSAQDQLYLGRAFLMALLLFALKRGASFGNGYMLRKELPGDGLAHESHRPWRQTWHSRPRHHKP